MQVEDQAIIGRAPRAASSSRRAGWGRFSIVLRRTHMYLGLFLTPWMLMYALSTVVFNHWEGLRRLYGGQMERFERERVMPYGRTFAAEMESRPMAEQILQDLNLSGDFRVNDDDEDRIVITRLDPLAGRRITYLPAEHKLVIERQVFRSTTFLTSLHSRVGYGAKNRAADLWAAGVDVTIFGSLIWILSGFWMWWELKATRRWGAVFTLLGIVLFGIFVAFS